MVLGLTALALASATMGASASAATPEEMMAQAEGHFAQRGDLAKNDQAIAVLDSLVKQQGASPALKYKAYCLASRAYYWKADNVAGPEEKNPAKVTVFQKGMDMAEAAKKLNAAPADAYYYYSINLGKWALAMDFMQVLKRKGELMDNLDEVLARKTADNQAGETLDYYGANRVYGKLYYKLPKMAGGNLGKSQKHLETARTRAPDHVLNHVFYAEYLSKDGDKVRAAKVLDEVIARDRKTWPSNRAPETERELGQARALLNELR